MANGKVEDKGKIDHEFAERTAGEIKAEVEAEDRARLEAKDAETVAKAEAEFAKKPTHVSDVQHILSDPQIEDLSRRSLSRSLEGKRAGEKAKERSPKGVQILVERDKSEIEKMNAEADRLKAEFNLERIKYDIVQFKTDRMQKAVEDLGKFKTNYTNLASEMRDLAKGDFIRRPDVSTGALDELKERGPLQMEAPEMTDQEANIMSTVISSAIANFAQTLAGATAEGEAAQTAAAVAPSVGADILAQGSAMVLSDIARFEERKQKVDDINFELLVKHEGDLIAYQQDLDNRLDAADKFYLSQLQTSRQFHEGLAQAYENMGFSAGKSEAQMYASIDGVLNQMEEINVKIKNAEEAANDQQKRFALEMHMRYSMALMKATNKVARGRGYPNATDSRSMKDVKNYADAMGNIYGYGDEKEYADKKRGRAAAVAQNATVGGTGVLASGRVPQSEISRGLYRNAASAVVNSIKSVKPGVLDRIGSAAVPFYDVEANLNERKGDVLTMLTQMASDGMDMSSNLFDKDKEGKGIRNFINDLINSDIPLGISSSLFHVEDKEGRPVDLKAADRVTIVNPQFADLLAKYTPSIVIKDSEGNKMLKFNTDQAAIDRSKLFAYELVRQTILSEE